jgi:hypothetical protein
MTSRSPIHMLTLLTSLLALFSCTVARPAASQALRAEVGAYELELLVDGVSARTFQHRGETHVLGEQGSRYVLRVHNRSGRRIEAVVSVDGLDVIDGKSADFAHKRGYLVPAHGYVDIDGWRLSEREAAAFRFAAVSDSYAAKSGKARNVGVIGVAVFPERVVRRVRESWPYESHDSYGAAPELRESEPSRGLGSTGAPTKGRSMRGSAPPAPASAPAAADEAPAEGKAEAKAASSTARRERSGLGTEFGEAVSSQISHVSFVRASASRPAVLLGARYNDRPGLYALGIDVDGQDDIALRQSASPFPMARHGYARPPADWRRD